MDPTLLAYVIQAVGGIVGGNILGALTRGGGGVVGRSLIGAIGGLGGGYAAAHFDAVSNITSMWGSLLGAGDPNSSHLSDLITGALGGGVLGLVGGLLIRPRG
jgi:hypothetical protein